MISPNTTIIILLLVLQYFDIAGREESRHAPNGTQYHGLIRSFMGTAS